MKAKRPLHSKKRDRSATEAALLESAMELFSKQGFDATTTREIADRAKVNEQLIQRYFGGKDGLLIAVMKSFRSIVLDQNPFGETPGKNLHDELNTVFSGAPEFFAIRGDLMKIGFSQALTRPKVAETLHRKISEEIIPETMKRIEGYKSKNWIDPELDPWAVTYGIMLMIFSIGFIGQFVHRMKPEQLKSVARAMAQVLAQGLAPKDDR